MSWTPNPLPRLGIRMDGTQARFLDLLLQRARVCQPTGFFLFELGTAEGITFGALCGVIKQAGLLDQSTLVSCDLPAGQSWSVDMAKILSNMQGSGVPWITAHSPVEPRKGAAQIYFRDGRVLLKELNALYGFSPDFSFIDGCHSSRCVTADFLAVESVTKPGAIIAFHDAGSEEEGTDWQNHCGEFISVRKALTALGLMDNTRPGWRFKEQIQGDRNRGGEGNSHVVVERVAI